MSRRDDYEESSREKGRFQAPSDFDGPTHTRSCTDVIFAGLIIIAWAAMTAIGINSWTNGNVEYVINPMDYEGNICGTNFGDMNMTDYPKLVYINSFGGGVCVEECPKVTDLVDVHTLITYGGVYQSEEAVLPADYVKMANYSNATYVKYCGNYTCNTNPLYSWNTPGILKGSGFAYYALDTYEVLNTRCISNPAAIKMLKTIIDTGTDPIDIDAWTDTQAFASNLANDLYQARIHIFTFGIFASMVIGFIYAQLLRFQPLLGFMIWGSILGCMAIIFAVGAFAYKSADEWKQQDPPMRSDFDIQGTKIFSYCMFGLGAIVVFLTIFLRKQIMLAMACVREAARSIGSMPIIVAFPLIQGTGLVLFLAVWLAFAVSLASTGEISDMALPTFAVVKVRTYLFDDFTKYCGWYLLFCLIWTIAFIQAIGEIVVAMSVSKWYFSRDKWKVGNMTVIKSMYDTIRYHLGTAAFGSFIIAVTQIIRIIVARAQKRARELGNKLGEAILCCCQCCLWVFEKVIKFLNKNAYIQTAIFGTPFCRSARESFALITRNAGKIGSITYVSTIVLFVGKCFISFLATGAAYIYIERDLGEDLYSVAGPLALIFALSYFVGDIFLDIFDMSTTTVLHCFVADEEMFDGDECYAEGKLREWISDFEESERRIVATAY